MATSDLLKNYPCLFDDFQIFLTLSDRLVHIDIDRCFLKNASWRGKVKKNPFCVPAIKYFESKVLEQIEHTFQILNGSTPNHIIENVTIQDYKHLFPREKKKSTDQKNQEKKEQKKNTKHHGKNQMKNQKYISKEKIYF
mmetsp:Transcript_30794/g.51179  ORF Transcript_30794/g.51179 Transcript_30794/m.51179 type:complete len:139 (-) Transcript_30794:33-449(-)